MLARQLELRGLPFALAGDPSRQSAIDVAAGIINPVTGRWMTKSWRFDELAPEAKAFYQSIERVCGRSLYHLIHATRCFLNPEDARRAHRRARNPRYADVLSTPREPGASGRFAADPYGSIDIHGVAWVDLPGVLHSLRERYQQHGLLLHGSRAAPRKK